METATQSSPVPSQSPERIRRRHRRSRRRNPRRKYEKSLVNFSILHITVGLLAACLQMVHFTNNSILSEPQPGLWCGAFFVVTGGVCLALSKIDGIYSTLVMLAFCLVSLFMALTLSSLSWLGSEASLICEETVNVCSNQTAAYDVNHSETSGGGRRIEQQRDECDTNNDGLYDCEDVFVKHCCGYNVSLGRTIHSMLMLVGILESTTSFILAAVACSRSTDPPRHRYPSLYDVAGDGHDVPGSHGARPVTAWDYPAPNKQEIFTFTLTSQFPEEPPPPYEVNGQVSRF